jgi:hypothetical protein
MPTIRKQEGRLGRGQKESKEMLDDQTAERLPEGEKDTEPNSQSKQVADQAKLQINNDMQFKLDLAPYTKGL